ncbi:hypothetical protein GCM10009660_54610 [Catellatospora bangladeshensis]
MLVLLAATVLAAAGLMVAMFVKDEPFYGAVGLGVLSGPGSVMALVHLAVA